MPLIRNDSTYLGDGLYASYDGFQVRVYASDGVRATDTVYFDPIVLAVFLGWLEQNCPAQFAHMKEAIVPEAIPDRRIIISHAQGDPCVVAIQGGRENSYLGTFESDAAAQAFIDSGEAAKKDQAGEGWRAGEGWGCIS